MNEVCIIGKPISEVKYKFILEKHNNAKAVISLELLDKTKLEVIACKEHLLSGREFLPLFYWQR